MLRKKIIPYWYISVREYIRLCSKRFKNRHIIIDEYKRNDTRNDIKVRNSLYEYIEYTFYE